MVWKKEVERLLLVQQIDQTHWIQLSDGQEGMNMLIFAQKYSPILLIAP
jgi:hypothetical protein